MSESEEDKKYSHFSTSLHFCHDFQNTFCRRPVCKFIHCSPDEVDEYKRTGRMSNQVLAEAARKNQLPGLTPICNEFRKGLCRRSNCKFRHLNRDEEKDEIMKLLRSNQRNETLLEDFNNSTNVQFEPVNGFRRIAMTTNNDDDSELPVRKRRLISNNEQNVPVFRGYCAGTPPAPILSNADARTLMLEDEIGILHKEINRLKKQVQDLTATNEFLLEQNANLRISKHNTSTSGSTAPQRVIGTVTNVPVSLSAVPVTLATVPVSLTTVTTCTPVPSVSIASPAQILTPSQQIFVSTNPSNQLAIANTSQAQLAIAASNAQQLTVTNVQPQLALTSQGQQQLTLTGQNQQQISLANQNQQIALNNQNQQLLAHQTLANSQQIDLQTSQSIAMSNATQALMSYPIVTHTIKNINHSMH